MKWLPVPRRRQRHAQSRGLAAGCATSPSSVLVAAARHAWHASIVVPSAGLEPATPAPSTQRSTKLSYNGKKWSGRRESNSPVPAWKARRTPLTTRVFVELLRGIEPRFADRKSAVLTARRQEHFHCEADFVPLPRQEARGVPTWRPGTAILCPAHPWRIRFRRACSRRRRWLRYGADSRLRTGDLHLGKVSFCQLNYVRKSGGSYPPPEDHIPELLRSNRPAYRSGHRPEWAGCRGGLHQARGCSAAGPSLRRPPIQSPTRRIEMIWGSVRLTRRDH